MVSRSAWASPAVKIVSLSLIALLLAGAAYAVRWAFSLPTEEQETITRVAYQHSGAFDYEVYANPSVLYGQTREPAPPETPNPTYYASLIDSIDASFSYGFISQQAVSAVVEEVEIKAVVETSGAWQKEVVLIPLTTESGNFTIDFPVDLEEFSSLASTISGELGTGVGSVSVTLVANVQVVAQTEDGVVEDEFVQTTKMTLASGKLEWQKGLIRSKNGSSGGLDYRQRGEFTYEITLKPSTLYGTGPAPATEGPKYFRRIIDSIDMSFSYGFASQQAVSSLNEDVRIRAVLASPGVWQKEVVLVPWTARSGNFTIDFPLDVGEFEDLASNISAQIAISSTSFELTLIADVRVAAQTGSDALEDQFSQSTKVALGGAILQWQGDLVRSKSGSSGGFSYEQRGEFAYRIHLKENILYGAITVTSPPPASEAPATVISSPPPSPPAPEPKPPTLLPKGQTYFAQLIDSVEGSFSYDFNCNPRPNMASATVNVTAVFAYTGTWSKTFVLVPDTTEIGDFTVVFPVDLDQLNEFANAVRSEIGLGAAQYDLTFNARVHLVAETDYGTIDEVYTQSLKSTLSSTTLSFGGAPPGGRTGSISETITVPKSVWPAKGGALGGLALVVLLGLYVVWKVTMTKPAPLSGVEAEARQAKRKHKDVIVDVADLPAAKAGDTVVSMNSIDQLVKVADGTLKPVLHKAEPGRHTYYVIDGSTRYEYVSFETPPPYESGDTEV